MKPGLIKAHNVIMQPQQLYAVLKIPIIDTGHTAEQKIEKMKEELDECLDEFCNGEVDMQAAWSEVLDIVQVMLGLQLAKNKEFQPPNDAVERTLSRANYVNDLHITKMENYSEERGWLQVTR
jgi:Fe2+ transport system protein B